jgi:ubiquinone/menaquinone biosynthesis C-methylase UbiE
MGVATHLGIDLADYDRRIRTFLPDYEEMLEVAAAAVPATARTIVDLGIGTGALAWRCAKMAPRANIVGVDADSEILQMARKRLGGSASLLCGSFLRTPIPRCDSAVASFALHHIRTQSAKAKLYRRIHAALYRRGRFITVDCHPASEANLARDQRVAWAAHLRKCYVRREAEKLLTAWSQEDTYTTLDREMRLLQLCGFQVEVLWRRASFAVLMGKRQ